MRKISEKLVILDKGDELHTSLQQLSVDEGYTSKWLNGIGGASAVTLGFYNPKSKEYAWRTFKGPHEIVSLSGNLAFVEGKPLWHIHGVLSGSDYQAIGGHVKELTVGLTCEIYLSDQPAPTTRQFDDDTGLKLIHTA